MRERSGPNSAWRRWRGPGCGRNRLAEGIDLAPLDELMANPKVLEVFHAARRDLEIFYLHARTQVPQPCLPTPRSRQWCAATVRPRLQRSLATKLAKAKIHDKSSRFTDWSRRPLSERQITMRCRTSLICVVYEKLKRTSSRGRAGCRGSPRRWQSSTTRRPTGPIPSERGAA